ncbi:MAG: hypothetical protein HYU58_02690 [Proteobacteria bacterium]|nr:hypothetical protein [Pseudomonadota bacterium]
MQFLHIIKRTAAVTAAIALLAACGAPPSLRYPEGATLQITSKVWGFYQEYLTKQGGVRKDGAFLVVMMGDVGVSGRYSYCSPTADYCTGGSINLANSMCIEEHLKCVLFARGPQIVVPYKIVDK